MFEFGSSVSLVVDSGWFMLQMVHDTWIFRMKDDDFTCIHLMVNTFLRSNISIFSAYFPLIEYVLLSIPHGIFAATGRTQNFP